MYCPLACSRSAFGRSTRLRGRAASNPAVEAVRKEPFDVCLLDYKLGPRTGLDFLEFCTRSGYRLPTILLTGLESPDIDELVLRGGAADYLVKDHVSTPLLERSILYAIERSRSTHALQRSEQLLRTTIDSLNEHLAILDAQGNIIATNEAWKQFARDNEFRGAEFGVGEKLSARVRKRCRGRRCRCDGCGQAVA